MTPRLLILCAVLLGCPAVERAAFPALDSPEARAEAGRERFTRYCASCHGREGTGDGPAAGSLAQPPADLTRIALRRGAFDPDFIARYIDGRIRVEAHGPSDMPVWGRRLDDRNDALYEESRLTPGAISLIVAYLESIQVEPELRGEQAEPRDARKTMDQIFDALAYLLPVSLDEERFTSPAERPRIAERLALLSSSAAELAEHAGQRELAFRLLSGSLRADTREIERRFTQQRYVEAQFFIQQLTENCVACHSRQPSVTDFPLGVQLLRAVDSEHMAPGERARLLVAVRQFEAALRTWEELLADPGRSPAELDLDGIPLDYLTVAIRVQGDPARALPVIATFSQRPDVPRYLAHHAAIWVSSLQDLASRPAPEPSLASARALLERGEQSTSSAAGREGLVYDLAASGLLNRFVADGDRPAEDLSQAYYLLGVIQARSGRASWVPETEHYLEASIRLAPATESAELAYLLLEEYTVLGYGGTSGVHLPPEVEHKLTELRGLLTPP